MFYGVKQLILVWISCLALLSCTKEKIDPPGTPIESDFTNLSLGQKALINAVNMTGAQSAHGRIIPLICDLSNQHLNYMISAGKISHDDFEERYQRIIKAGGTTAAEIVASNCGSDSIEQAAKTCAKSWVNSPGHWEHMRKQWNGYCYNILATRNECFYCIGLFGNGKF